MKLMGDLHWHRARRMGGVLVSSNGRFWIERQGASSYLLLDKSDCRSIHCFRLKAAKALAERIRVEELDEIEERERLARR